MTFIPRIDLKWNIKINILLILGIANIFLKELLCVHSYLILQYHNT